MKPKAGRIGHVLRLLLLPFKFLGPGRREVIGQKTSGRCCEPPVGDTVRPDSEAAIKREPTAAPPRRLHTCRRASLPHHVCRVVREIACREPPCILFIKAVQRWVQQDMQPSTGTELMDWKPASAFLCCCE